MPATTEFSYKESWIELTAQEDEGLYLAGIRITRDCSSMPTRHWETLDPEPAIYFDFEDASEDALAQAKAYIDKAKAL